MNKKIIALLSSATLLLLPLVTFAAGTNFICDIFDRLINMVLWPLFLALVIIMTLWAAILFVTAQGDPGKIETAKKMVIWIVIGVIIAFVAFSIVGLVKSIVDPSSGVGFCSSTSGGGGGGGSTGGACCVTDNINATFTCINAGDSTSCDGYGGSYKGDGSTCTNPGVPGSPNCDYTGGTGGGGGTAATGACYWNGTCSIQTQAACLGATYGNKTYCGDNKLCSDPC